MMDHRLYARALQVVFFVLLILPLQTLAFEHWNISIEKDLKTVFVYNRSPQPQVLWISGPIAHLPANPDEKLEHAITVDAYGSSEIPLIDFPGLPWLHFKTDNPKALLLTVMNKNGIETNLNSGSTERWTSRAISGADLVLLNLAPIAQKIQLTDTSQDPTHSYSVVVEAFGKHRTKLPTWAGGRNLIIQGEARIHGFLIDPTRSQSFTPSLDASPLKPSLDSTYFRLSNRSGSQSYIVGLNDAKMIEQARDQIRQPMEAPGPWLPRILVAEIDYGSGNENRDWSKPGKPVWSWHIKQVFNFAHLAHQDCDGSPEMLEEFLQPWKEGSAIICFWSYHVVEEISTSQLAQPPRSPSTRHPAQAFPQP